MVEQEYGAGGVDLFEQIGGVGAVRVHFIGTAEYPEAVVHVCRTVVQHRDAGLLQRGGDFGLVAEQIVVAQCGINAQRRAQALQVRLHVFHVVGFGIVVHQIAGQEDDVYPFALHDAHQLVDLPAAEQHAQVQVAGHADAHRLIQRLADAHCIMPHHRRVGIVERQREQTGKQPCRQYAPRRQRTLRRPFQAQQAPDRPHRQHGQHAVEQHHQPQREQTEQYRRQMEKQNEKQPIADAEYQRPHGTAGGAAQTARQQPQQPFGKQPAEQLHH